MLSSSMTNQNAEVKELNYCEYCNDMDQIHTIPFGLWGCCVHYVIETIVHNTEAD